MSDIRADLNVLFIEDSDMDVQLILRELRKNGYAPKWERVATDPALREALAHGHWELVIADANVPNLDPVQALATAKELAPDVPFIVVSGRVTPDVMRSVAAECISKHALKELAEAVLRALRPITPALEDEAQPPPPPDALKHLLLATQEMERRRIARGLHDTFAQLLTLLKLTLDSARRSEGEAREQKIIDGLGLVDQALAQTRDLSVQLWPTILDDMGLCSALRWLAERYVKSAGLAIDLAVDDIPRLPFTVTTACFRLVQEALTNIARHAEARAVTVQVRTSDLALQVLVRDDGKGFDTTEAWRRAASGESLGLFMMRERATLASGQLTIESAPGQGTTVSAWFPMTGDTLP